MFYIYVYIIAWLLVDGAGRGRAEKFYVNHTVGPLRPPYAYKEKNYQIIIPKRVDANAAPLSYAMRHHYRRRDADGGDMHLMIPIAGRNHHVELRPSRHLMSPGMLIETFKHARRSHIQRPRARKNRQCHYTGKIRGKRMSRAALSTCNGLSGYIQTDEGLFMIEPKYATDHSADRPHPHLLYPPPPRERTNLFCATSAPKPEDDIAAKRKREENLADAVAELNIETLVVLDQSFLHHHKDVDIENYVLTVFNMAHDLFHDSTLGVNINLAIVRLIRLEVEDHEMNLAMNHKIEKSLQHFRMWQQRINPKEDTHPNHHDMAVLLTRIDICGDDKTCGFLGAARFAGMCDPENEAVIAQDSGLFVGYTIAHEIGHTMGLVHDDFPPQLDLKKLTGPLDEVLSTVMSPHLSDKVVEWSKCSHTRLTQFINYGFGACLFDTPTEHTFVLPDELPGVMYDGDHQCREIFGPNAALCMTALECDNLICYSEDKGCIETHTRAADGTACGQDQWCFHGECVEAGERKSAVHGNWSEWGEWSKCTRSCGSGVTMQKRYCNNPAPKFGGQFCDGENVKHKICATEPCDLGQPSFRDIQCAEFDSWKYPGDNLMHQWKSYPIHDENQCELYCVNEDGNVASLRARVIDGTTCYRGIRDICINGLCKEIPCDLDLQSSSVEDRCGVCKGDGTSCDVVRGEQEMVCASQVKLEQSIITIPAGAVNIKVEEMHPSETRIQVRNAAGTAIYINGDVLGKYIVHGSDAWIGNVRTKQEAISILGPLHQPVSIWANVLQNSTLKYAYGVPAKQKRAPVFSWDYISWSPCSTECGPGLEENHPKCVEHVSGLVDDCFCHGIPRLKTQHRECELAPCKARWFVGEWGECQQCTLSRRHRIVRCYKPVGNGESELDFIPDKFCANNKPKTSESCKCKRGKREGTTIVPSTCDDSYEDDDDAANMTSTTHAPLKVRSIIDFVSLKHIKLTVHTELEHNKYAKNLPHPKGANDTSFEIHGMEALKFMNSLQHDFANNKTKV